MIIFIEYKGSEKHWSYYRYDEKNYKTTVEGFQTHIKAKEHATLYHGGDIWNDIEFKYK